MTFGSATTSLPQATRKFAGKLPSVSRLFWLAVLLLHLPGLLSLGGLLSSHASNGEALAAGSVTAADGILAAVRVAAMTLSASFFLLKVLDVRWLRFSPGWRAKVALMLVLLILHAGVVERAVSGTLDASPVQIGLVMILAGAANRESLERGWRFITAGLPVNACTRGRHQNAGFRTRYVDSVRRIPTLLYISSCTSRAPPFSV